MLTYLLLVLCLVASNWGRLHRLFSWIGFLLTRPRSPRLVPYYDSEGRLIGMVRLDHSVRRPPERAASKRRRARPELHGTESPGQSTPQVTLQDAHSVLSTGPLPTPEISLGAWDGWPDGTFRLNLTHQQFVDTSELAVHWVSDSIRTRRGSPSALTWERGKESRRRCVGVMECRTESCHLQLAPAARGIDRHRQLQKECICGETLRLRPCAIVFSTYLFRHGAVFVHSGDHTHGNYTHSLVYLAHEEFKLTDFTAKRAVPLNDSSLPHTAGDLGFNDHDNASDSEHSSWHGIETAREDGTFSPIAIPALTPAL
ncbi:hypothetical protein C8J57DRAFT_1408023 [Mycena rebaudengoi]|nr:hypothetical protein C8J57DRAFT_1408023 [Mycena rebaudengoi]